MADQLRETQSAKRRRGGPELALAENMSQVDIVRNIDNFSELQIKLQQMIQQMSLKLDQYFGSRDICMQCNNEDLQSFLQDPKLEVVHDLMQEIIQEQYEKHKLNNDAVLQESNAKLWQIYDCLTLIKTCIENVNGDQRRQYSKLSELETLLSTIRQGIHDAELNTSSKIEEQNKILQSGLQEIKTQLQTFQESMLEHFGEQKKNMQTETQQQTQNMSEIKDSLRDLHRQNVVLSKEQESTKDNQVNTQEELSFLQNAITQGLKENNSEISKLTEEFKRFNHENYMQDDPIRSFRLPLQVPIKMCLRCQ